MGISHFEGNALYQLQQVHDVVEALKQVLEGHVHCCGDHGCWSVDSVGAEALLDSQS